MEGGRRAQPFGGGWGVGGGGGAFSFSSETVSLNGIHPIHRMATYVLLHGKSVFVGVINLRILDDKNILD